MYFLKFMKWFFMDYLDDTFERFIAVLMTWAFFGVVVAIIAGINGSGLILIWYMAVSFACLLFGILMIGILYMRARYFEWQQKVFDKLKGN